MKRLLIILYLLFITSCSSTRYIEVPVEHTKLEYVNRVHYDSVYIKDSIDRFINGDTIYITKYNMRYIYKTKTDTMIRTDSISFPVYVDKEVIVNKLKWYQSGLMVLGIIFILYILLALFMRVK